MAMGAAELSAERTFKTGTGYGPDQRSESGKADRASMTGRPKLKGTQFTWLDNAFDLARLNATVQDDALSIQGLSMNLAAPGLPSMKGTIRLNSDDLAHQLTPLGVKDITGPLQINIKANGELDALSAKVDVAGGPISVPGESE